MRPDGTGGGAPRPRRVLVGGVGYRFTRDLAFGPLVVDRLRAAAWPDGVEVEDLSYAPIAIVQRWQQAPYDRVVLIGAAPRGEEPGTLRRFCPSGLLPDPEETQRRVAEALTGVISLDNLVVVTRAFGALPRDVEVIEVEPHDVGWGDGLSPSVAAAADHAVALAREAAGVGAARADAVDALRQRDEILQVLYWMEGEGLADDVDALRLVPFVGADVAAVGAHLEALRRIGYLERTAVAPDRYRLSVIGRAEGRRRFEEEFAPLLRQGHGECNDPACDCHLTGDPAACVHRDVRPA